MEEARGSDHCSIETVCGALRFLGDASYAVLPRDLAHQLGELKKNFWSGLR